MGICHWDRGLITAPETPEKNPCCCLDSMNSLVTEPEISSPLPFSVVVQPGLCLIFVFDLSVPDLFVPDRLYK